MTPYLTVSEADVLVSANKLSSQREGWDAATPDDRNIALIQATRRIDRLNFVGDRTAAAEAAGNQFPRGSDTEVPEDIKMACMEEAVLLLSGFDPEFEMQNLFVASQAIANVKTTYSRDVLPEHIVAGIMSSEAWKYLAAYLRDSRTVKIRRA